MAITSKMLAVKLRSGTECILDAKDFHDTGLVIHISLNDKVGYTITHINSGWFVVDSIPTFALAKQIASWLTSLGMNWKATAKDIRRNTPQILERVVNVRNKVDALSQIQREIEEMIKKDATT